MSIKNDFAVGDYVIDFESIYLIYDQQTKKNSQGKECLYYFYKPVTLELKLESVISSLPANNFSSSGFRHLIKKSDIEEIFSVLEKPLDDNSIFDFKTTRETIYLNNPTKNIIILKQLNNNKKEMGDKFSRINKELMESILNHLTAEIAFVTKGTPEPIKTKILSFLKN